MGDVYDDAYQYAKQLEQAQDLVFIHPYDDIEGHGRAGDHC